MAKNNGQNGNSKENKSETTEVGIIRVTSFGPKLASTLVEVVTVAEQLTESAQKKQQEKSKKISKMKISLDAFEVSE